jgi:hypothetical protein
MDYEIYFDESNKLDQNGRKYAYYAALGGEGCVIDDIKKYISDLFVRLNSKSEMHFSRYKNDKHLFKYFHALNYLFQQDVRLNLFVVNISDAVNIAKQMDIPLKKMRELFYVKVPERLFYGLTRDLSKDTNIDLYIDENDEYEHIDFYAKLNDQMNAHSAYRKKRYYVRNVSPKDSEESLAVQLTDVCLGIGAFLFEGLYKKADSINSVVKSDLIFRLLISNHAMNFYQERTKVFLWEGDHEEITEVPLSAVINDFLMNKREFDQDYMYKVIECMYLRNMSEAQEIRKSLNISNSQLRMVYGLIDEIRHHNRNYFLEEKYQRMYNS